MHQSTKIKCIILFAVVVVVVALDNLCFLPIFYLQSTLQFVNVCMKNAEPQDCML